MEYKLITEISRITEIMGADPIISEAVKPPTGLISVLKKLVSNSSDETISKVIAKTGIQSTDNAIDDIIVKLKNGENIGKKSLNLLLSQINGNELSKILVKSKKIIGEDFYNSINRYQRELKNGADKEVYDRIIHSINTLIDNDAVLKNLPKNIKNALKLELKTKMDNAVIASKKPKPTQTSTTTPTTNSLPRPNSSISNIQKTWDEVTESIPVETIDKISKKYGKQWSSSLVRLKNSITVPFKTSLKLQNEIIEDFGIWKLAKPNERPIIKNKIIDKLNALENSQSNILESTNTWIEKEIRPKAAGDADIRMFYNQIKDKKGWGKIKMLENVYNSINISIKDILDNGKNLNKAYLKVLFKPVTIPTNIMSTIINKVSSKNLNMIGELTPEQTIAFKNWFWTTNPAGLKGLRLAFKNNGIIGGLTYVGSQALYRYFLVSFYLGIFRTVGALATEGIDLGLKTEISDNKIINFLFGTKDFNELNKKFKEDPNKSNYEYATALGEMIKKQSEPFRKWFGWWPASKFASVVWEAIKATQNGTLEEKVKKLEQDVKTAEKELEQAAGASVEKILDNKTTPVIDKTKEVIDSAKIEITELDFEEFALKNNFTIMRPYDGVTGETNEVDPNGKKTNRWYYEKEKGTFVSY
jgi:hypothetical protein